MLTTTGTSSTLPTLHEGRFVITSVLGKGGNAHVYTAWDTVLRAWRAIKVLSPAFIEDAEVRARFAQEAASMARLDHPHIVKVYDISDDPFTPHIVMELCEAGAVIDWMREHGALPPRLALTVIRQIAQAVQHAHENGLVHRDIKPQNILVDQYGIAKLTDFGIAQVENSGLTQAGATIGTYAFMAPEQRHDATTVDERSDIYSLGATLFTMSQVKTTTELFIAEPDDAIFDGLPEPLVEFILKACAYRPRERFQTVEELLGALDSLAASLPADPEGPPLQALARKLPPRPSGDLPNLEELEDLLKALALHEQTHAGPELDPTTLGGRGHAVPTPVGGRAHAVPTPVGGRGSRPATPTPVPEAETLALPLPTPAPAPMRAARAGGIALVVALFLGATGVASIVGIGFVLLGVVNVSGAHSQVRMAERDLVTSVLAAAPAIDGLQDPAALRDLYEGVQGAGPEQAARNARAFATTLEHSVAQSTPEGDAILLSRNVFQADLRLELADEAWADAADSWTGSTAVLLGLAEAP